LGLKASFKRVSAIEPFLIRIAEINPFLVPELTYGASCVPKWEPNLKGQETELRDRDDIPVLLEGRK
jgi:hypothetical protein